MIAMYDILHILKREHMCYNKDTKRNFKNGGEKDVNCSPAYI